MRARPTQASPTRAAAAAGVARVEEADDYDEGYIPPDRLRLIAQMQERGRSGNTSWLGAAASLLLLALIAVLVVNTVLVMTGGRQLPFVKTIFGYLHEVTGAVVGSGSRSWTSRSGGPNGGGGGGGGYNT